MQDWVLLPRVFPKDVFWEPQLDIFCKAGLFAKRALGGTCNMCCPVWGLDCRAVSPNCTGGSQLCQFRVKQKVALPAVAVEHCNMLK